ncbi:hypothetical protein JGU71_25295 [Antrihabitans sp. YC3-6]|uniref:Uncharacterized protein n=1 Tax=Antrihabitans stalagmiti TaxID=2799499 RepID=A0A934U674_9NOCA|nr:hypothetical protein [Antrihabitans stalagmiti]
MRRQDAGSTRPRPQTVADARARDKARQRQAELDRQAAEHSDKKRKTRRRLIGAGAVVGVVGAVALGYYALRSDDVRADCVAIEDGQEIIVDDQFCDGTPNSSGVFIYAGSGKQYRYYYGGSGSKGDRISGGTTVKPKGANITTSSGKTVQRGGLGSKFSSSSGS